MSEARTIRCSNCGAPLDVAPYVPTARCSYCGRIVQVPAESRPAPHLPPLPTTPFTPPARSRLIYLVYLIPLLLIGTSVIASVVVQPKASGTATNEARVTPEQLATLDLAATREQVTQRLGGKGFASRYGLHLQLGYRDIESVYLNWGTTALVTLRVYLLTVSFGRRHDAVSADLWKRLMTRLQSCR